MDLSNVLGGSKTEKILILILVLIVAFGILAVVVLVLFNKSVLDILAVVYGALGLNGAGSVFRNIKVDAPIRQQEALNQTAITAQKENVVIPIAPNLASNQSTSAVPLQVWKPEENKP